MVENFIFSLGTRKYDRKLDICMYSVDSQYAFIHRKLLYLSQTITSFYVSIVHIRFLSMAGTR